MLDAISSSSSSGVVGFVDIINRLSLPFLSFLSLTAEGRVLSMTQNLHLREKLPEALENKACVKIRRKEFNPK